MEPKQIVIIGAGFGGLTAALTLARHRHAQSAYQILLVDQNPYHLYTPALYEIAAIPRQKESAHALKTIITIPLNEICSGYRALTFLQDAFVGIQHDKSRVLLRDTGSIKYDFLILALGSETNHFNIPGLKQHAHSFKNFADAITIRNKIAFLYQTQPAIKIVICGGGASGVELAAECANYLSIIAKNKHKNHEIVLIEGSEKILPGFHERLRSHAEKRLKNLGITVKTGIFVKRISAKKLFLNDTEEILFDICVWAGGIQGNALVEKLGMPLGNKKTLSVNSYLEVAPRIHAIGDIAEVRHPKTGQFLPASVPVAEAEARYVARNIITMLRNKQPYPFMPWQRYPFILALGKKYAYADLVFFRVSGILAWFLKLVVEFRYFLFLLPLPRALVLWYKNIRAYAAND